ncbi:TetR/AcrR family transcriptional regulator [Haliea sp. E17]|uniref:TetR/AcrR family transcriptional regulator n=1 Tax=Haliea sp. E17 TaxID=3401576 RepID=UPI003AAD6DA5
MTARAVVSTGDPRIARTREALRLAMLELLERKPLEQVTISDIVTTAGVGKTTFFRHFSSKEALLDAIAADQIERLIGLTLPISEACDHGAAAVALFSYVDAHRPLWSALLTGGAAGAVREAYLQQARAIAAEKARPGGWLPADCGVVLVISGTIELLTWWLAQPEPLPVKRVAGIYEKVVVAPVLEAGSR